jgi:Mn2+/Fe2+ NRAMP family transporter
VLLPVVLIAILFLINNRELMGEHINGRWQNIFGWGTAIFVGALSIILVVVSFTSNP